MLLPFPPPFAQPAAAPLCVTPYSLLQLVHRPMCQPQTCLTLPFSNLIMSIVAASIISPKVAVYAQPDQPTDIPAVCPVCLAKRHICSSQRGPCLSWGDYSSQSAVASPPLASGLNVTPTFWLLKMSVSQRQTRTVQGRQWDHLSHCLC